MSNGTVAPLPILVVEDDSDWQFLIKSTLSADPRLKCITATTSAIEATALTLSVGPALVIVDHKIEGEIMGLQVAPMIKSIAPTTRIILFTVLDLLFEARNEPAIDLYLPKSKMRKLLSAAQKLMKLEPLA
jgi:DNA-binding NarL/FixJ family response regulator